MDSNSYESIAKRDLKEAKILYEHDAYNTAARLAQQCVEKIMKAKLEATGDTAIYKLLKVHNLTLLYKAMVDKGLLTYEKEVRDYLAVLKDYYFDLNYPGENYWELEQTDANEAILFAQDFFERLVGN